ncbi:MAG: lactonase family protein [Fermentimonas sp.]|nr:lactonase family protein [Fermentimonas sp.]MDD4696305.1 lactonase family protein [Fermentimonas sp.]
MVNKLVMMVLSVALLSSCSENKSSDRSVSEEERAGVSELQSNSGDMFLLIGTYTSDNGSKGIYVHKFNTDTGVSDSVSMVEMENPSYLTLSPDMNFVYAVSEGGEDNSAAYSFSFDRKKGLLTPLNSQPTLSADPCYITIDSKGKNLHTANYSGGSITTFHVNSEGGLTEANSVMFFEGSGPDSIRQKKSHLHSVMYSPDGLFLFAADLGTDKLYRISVLDSPFEGQPSFQQNSLKEFSVPAGTGPRHFDFHPDSGRYLYLLGELSGEVLVFDYNYGNPELKQTIASDTTGARGSADIHVSPDGRFLYASNRLNADGIAIFSINADDGMLTKVGYQPTASHPRNFVITPNGKYLLTASRDENRIQVFKIDMETGMLTDTNQDILINKPVCLKFSTMG